MHESLARCWLLLVLAALAVAGIHAISVAYGQPFSPVENVAHCWNQLGQQARWTILLFVAWSLVSGLWKFLRRNAERPLIPLRIQAWLLGLWYVTAFIVIIAGGSFLISFAFGQPYSFVKDVKYFWFVLDSPGFRGALLIIAVPLLLSGLWRFSQWLTLSDHPPRDTTKTGSTMLNGVVMLYLLFETVANKLGRMLQLWAYRFLLLCWILGTAVTLLAGGTFLYRAVRDHKW